MRPVHNVLRPDRLLAHSRGRGKTGREHRSNSLVPFNWAFGYLMVDRACVVKGAQRINVRPIESLDPSLYDITRTHRSTLLNCRSGFKNSHILSRVWNAIVRTLEEFDSEPTDYL